MVESQIIQHDHDREREMSDIESLLARLEALDATTRQAVLRAWAALLDAVEIEPDNG